MLKEGFSLYFLAILPPAKIQEEITEFKFQIAEKFGSDHALKSPPHITLHMPFKWKEKKRGDLIQLVHSMNESFESLKIEINGFDFFEPRVVFVNVVQDEKLNYLQKEVVSRCRKELKLDNGNYKKQPFHPHITIGFRDLKKPAFYEAKKEFDSKSYSREFTVGQVSLLKHDNKKWELISI